MREELLLPWLPLPPSLFEFGTEYGMLEESEGMGLPDPALERCELPLMGKPPAPPTLWP